MIKENVKKIGKTMEKNKAKKWVKDYQKRNPDGTHGWLFGCDIICKLLEYEGAEGIWFFKAINDDGNEKLVMYAADKDGNILDRNMKSLGAMSRKDDDGIDLPADDSAECPPNCPPL